MAGACSDNLSRLIKFLGESGAAFYLERAGKQLFILGFPIFNYLTSYHFSKIRTDLELIARYNDVSIARTPFVRLMCLTVRLSLIRPSCIICQLSLSTRQRVHSRLSDHQRRKTVLGF